MSATSPLAGRLTLKVGTGSTAQVFDQILSAAIGRDMRDVAGTFELEVYDAGRALAAMAQASQGASGAPLTQGTAATLAMTCTTRGSIARVCRSTRSSQDTFSASESEAAGSTGR